MSLRFAILLFAFFALYGVAAAQTPPSYIEFESGPVRPLALSKDGKRLYACNIPDDRLEIFDVTADGLRLVAAVPVGLSPVAVAERNASEVWVVNHVSDSVSVVDVDATPPRVVRTLLVGDEPRDIVFAENGRAFVTTAHRGEQRVSPSLAKVPGAGDPKLTTPGVGRADVWVFDPDQLGTPLGGTPLRIISLFGDTPRALAVAGNTVYAAIFYSGNQTTGVNEETVCNGFMVDAPCDGDGITSPNGLPGGKLPGGMLPPSKNVAGVLAPEAGLIVKFDNESGEWRDGFGRNWSNGVRFFLPDKDVFAIDAGSLEQTRTWQHVGTTLFNMAVNPANGKLYVTNTDSQNLTRFEGPGTLARKLGADYKMPPTVQGNLAQARISILDDSDDVAVRHLNPHIDYAVTPAPEGTADASLATPLQLVFSSDGKTAYVAAYGSRKIGVIDTATLEAGKFDSRTAAESYISLRGGPAGLALDEANGRLYVLNRFENTVSAVDLDSHAELQRLQMTTPEPEDVRIGRPFLYDARETSSNGEAACASCHIFGEMDHLSWDLGNPDDVVTLNPLLITLPIGEGFALNDQNGGAALNEFHPMKGLMTTQTLKGMVNHGAMHWRGDRANGELGTDVKLGPPYDSHLSFINFIVATKGLHGRAEENSAEDMDKFAKFALQMTLPPNPLRRLDNDLQAPHAQLTAGDPFRGREYHFGRLGAPSSFGGPHLSDGTALIGQGFTCEGCHTTEPANGYYGSDGTAAFDNIKQTFKVAPLRNLYQKIGMFGQPNSSILTPGSSGSFEHQGDQVRGFGFEHEGTLDTVFRFFQLPQFRRGGFFGNEAAVGFENDQQRRDVEAFMLAFENDLAPIVGQQVTLDDSNASAVGPRIDLLLARADAAFASKLLGPGARECEVIVKAVVNGKTRGFLRKADGLFYPDDESAPLNDTQVRALAKQPGQPVTYTAVPFGSGTRMGIDRDLDGEPDGVDETSDDGQALDTLEAPPRPPTSNMDAGVRGAERTPDEDDDEKGPSRRDAGSKPGKSDAQASTSGSGCSTMPSNDGAALALFAVALLLLRARSRARIAVRDSRRDQLLAAAPGCKRR